MDDLEFELTDEVMKSFQQARIDQDHKSAINSIDFSDDGNYLITADDLSVHLFDVKTAKKLKTLHNMIDKIALVRFTHNSTAILCATKKDHKILYWSIHENEINRVYEGHKDAIICLQLNPVNDIFLSTSKDQTIMLWDLALENSVAIGVMNLKSKNATGVGNFDPTGLVFAVAFVESINKESAVNAVKLYDISNFKEGNFVSFKVDCPEIRCLKFSNTGKHILLSTIENSIIILDAYDGFIRHKLTDHINESSLLLEASFTPDSRYVLSGSEDGRVLIWDVENGTLVSSHEAHIMPSAVLKFSPDSALFVSGCKNLIFWLPSKTDNS